jgi:hypothetical protein
MLKLVSANEKCFRKAAKEKLDASEGEARKATI